MSLLVLSAADVDRVTALFTPDELQVLCAIVFFALTRPDTNEAYSPLRTMIPMTYHNTLFMPSRIAPIGTAIKVVSVPNEKNRDQNGLPGTTLVLDNKTGAAKAVVNARNLTALRTAAGSLLATRLVGPSNPESIVVFGAGKQAEMHIDLHLRFFPTIKQCTIFNRSMSRSASLVQILQPKFPGVNFVAYPLFTEAPSPEVDEHELLRRWAISRANIICCCTSSTEALFPCALVSNETHLNLIGSYKPYMGEVETSLIQRALPHGLLVDSADACLQEAGEIISAGLSRSDLIELGDLIQDLEGGDIRPAAQKCRDIKEKIRTGSGISVYKSVGIGLMDVTIAAAVVDRAEKRGIGIKIGGYDFVGQV